MLIDTRLRPPLFARSPPIFARRMLGPVIGVYDSGFGGLTVLRALRARLPGHDFVYLGDSGRAPYGGRDADTILDFSGNFIRR